MMFSDFSEDSEFSERLENSDFLENFQFSILNFITNPPPGAK